jgi:hypothetical protein
MVGANSIIATGACRINAAPGQSLATRCGVMRLRVPCTNFLATSARRQIVAVASYRARRVIACPNNNARPPSDTPASRSRWPQVRCGSCTRTRSSLAAPGHSGMCCCSSRRHVDTAWPVSSRWSSRMPDARPMRTYRGCHGILRQAWPPRLSAAASAFLEPRTHRFESRRAAFNLRRQALLARRTAAARFGSGHTTSRL